MRGELNLQSGKAELARSDFDKALTLQPKNIRALLGRAQIYLTGGR